MNYGTKLFNNTNMHKTNHQCYKLIYIPNVYLTKEQIPLTVHKIIWSTYKPFCYMKFKAYKFGKYISLKSDFNFLVFLY